MKTIDADAADAYAVNGIQSSDRFDALSNADAIGRLFLAMFNQLGNRRQA